MILAVCATVVYVVLGLTAAVLVTRARRRSAAETVTRPFVSVIVAARNEEATITECLDALSDQDYPSALIEFIIVDDESSDGTYALVEARVAADSRFRLLRSDTMPGYAAGKASALHTGILEAQGNLLLITDADCRPPSNWAAGMVSMMQDPQLGIVGGMTRIIGSSLHSRLQAADWTLLKGVAAGWSLAGVPITAMGNNMAVRHAAYETVGGYPSLKPSVTEDYALYKAIGETSWKARLDPHPAVENRTLAEPALRDVFRQRRRWASGAIASSPLAMAFYVAIYAAHLLPLLLLATRPEAGLIMMGAKVITDGIVLAASSAARRTWANLLIWPLYELYLYAYLLILPVSLAVEPEITWKERPFRHVNSEGAGA